MGDRISGGQSLWGTNFSFLRDQVGLPTNTLQLLIAPPQLLRVSKSLPFKMINHGSCLLPKEIAASKQKQGHFLTVFPELNGKHSLSCQNTSNNNSTKCNLSQYMPACASFLLKRQICHTFTYSVLSRKISHFLLMSKQLDVMAP